MHANLPPLHMMISNIISPLLIALLLSPPFLAFSFTTPLQTISLSSVSHNNYNNRPTCITPNTFLLRALLEDAVDEDWVKESFDIASSSSFVKLGLTAELVSSIDAQGWDSPTPIQNLAIPALLQLGTNGNNNNSNNNESAEENMSLNSNGKEGWKSVWAEAPTGSGKTAAFVLPLIQLTMDLKRQEYQQRQKMKKISNSSSRTNHSHIQTLILSPTRELAMQIGGVLEEIIEAMPSSPSSKGKKRNNQDIDVVVITGGVPLEPQIEELTKRKNSNENVDIVVATPGRLVDVLLHSTKVDAKDAELEKKLLQALDEAAGGNSKRDTFLSLSKLDELGINTAIETGDDGGRSNICDMLQGVEYLVIDEADRLLGQGFRKEMDELLKVLLPSSQNKKASTAYDNESYYGNGGVMNSQSGTGIKTSLFSATYPDHIQPRIEKVLQMLSGEKRSTTSPPLRPLRLSCSSSDNKSAVAPFENLSSRQKKRIKQQQQSMITAQGPESTIDLRTIRIEDKDRTQALLRLIRENAHGKNKWDRVLVFVSTRYATQHVTKKLRRFNIAASELHGKLDFDARIRRLKDFKRGKIQVLISTDLAGRGLDIDGLSAVINYDLPRSTADFTHRIGRTGRAGNRGTAISFVTPSNEAHFSLIEKRHFTSPVVWEVLNGFEPDEEKWALESALSTTSAEGVKHSGMGLAHDQMFGGIKGRRKSKKDKLRQKTILDNLEP